MIFVCLEQQGLYDSVPRYWRNSRRTRQQIECLLGHHNLEIQIAKHPKGGWYGPRHGGPRASVVALAAFMMPRGICLMIKKCYYELTSIMHFINILGDIRDATYILREDQLLCPINPFAVCLQSTADYRGCRQRPFRPSEFGRDVGLRKSRHLEKFLDLSKSEHLYSARNSLLRDRSKRASAESEILLYLQTW